MMKRARIIALVLALCTIFSMFSTVLAYDMTTQNDALLISPNPNANNSIRVLLNDQVIDFTDDNGNVVEPQIINDRTMVPMRKIFEVFGAGVEWEGTTQTITATTENKTLVLQINNPEAIVKSGDSEEKITLDSAPVIYNDRTLVPVRFIAESLELRVGWVSDTRTVVILDTNFIYDRLQKETPIFYEILTTQYIEPKTAEIAIDGTATINYKDDQKSISNTRTLLDAILKLNENALSIDATLKTTGKGNLLDTLKEKGFDNISLNELIDYSNSVAYIKSSLLESKIGKKWAKIELPESLKGINNEYRNITYKEMINSVLDSIELNENTYYELDELLDVVCGFLSDKYFTVSGRTTKTYSYNLSLEDAINLLGLNEDEIKDSTQISKAQIIYAIKVKNNYISEENLQVNLTIEDGKESIDIKIDTNSVIEKIDEKISITMPSTKNVTEVK